MSRLLRFLSAFIFVAALRAAEPAPQPTVIVSDGPGEMVSTDKESTFTFRDHVVVTGTNLKLSCDELVVVATRTGDPKATFGKQENFKSLLATGHVVLVQSDREVIADRAEVLPGKDKVLLTGNPVRWRTLDGKFGGSGPEAEINRGEMRVIIKAPRFVLPPLKDLGPDKDKKTSPADAAAPKVAPPK